MARTLNIVSLDELQDEVDRLNARIDSIGGGVDPATATPQAPGTAAVGTSLKYAREDHRHSSDAPTKATTVPVANGTAAIGTLNTYAAANHVHPSDTTRVPFTGGTLTGSLVAHTSTDYTTARVRNISASTTDLTAGSSALSNGHIYLVYE